MMANDVGVEYEKVRAAIRFDYPRAADLPGAGLAAGRDAGALPRVAAARGAPS